MAGIPRGSDTVTTNGPVGRDGKGYGLLGMRYSKGGGGSWEPTIVYLIILVVAEMLAYGALRYFFRSVHGG